MSTGFWAEIDRQIEALETAKTADEVFQICPASPARADAGFFAGGGGDATVARALRQAGWRTVWAEASYYWCMRAPNGDLITYVEGDLQRGDGR